MLCSRRIDIPLDIFNMGDNAGVNLGHDLGAAEGEPTSHRAEGAARIGLPDQPWWRTAIDNHRIVLLVGVVMVGYVGLAVRAVEREDWLVGAAGVGVLAATAAALVGWLRPGHRLRRLATFALVLLVAAPFLWAYLSH